MSSVRYCMKVFTSYTNHSQLLDRSSSSLSSYRKSLAATTIHQIASQSSSSDIGSSICPPMAPKQSAHVAVIIVCGGIVLHRMSSPHYAAQQKTTKTPFIRLVHSCSSAPVSLLKQERCPFILLFRLKYDSFRGANRKERRDVTAADDATVVRSRSREQSKRPATQCHFLLCFNRAINNVFTVVRLADLIEDCNFVQ